LVALTPASVRSNVRSRFELKGDDPARVLRFQFLLNEGPLAVTRSRGAVQAQPAQSQPAQPAALVPVTAAPALPAANGNGKGKGKKAAPPAQRFNPDIVQHKTAKLFDFGNMITGWLVAVSYFVPGRAGSVLRARVATVRGAQFDAQETTEMPGRFARMGQHVVDPIKVKSPGSHLAEAVRPPEAGAKPKPAPAAAAAATVTAPAAAMTAPALSAAPAAGTTVVNMPASAPAAPVVAVMSASGWAATPYVEPGGKLNVKLVITPVRVPRSELYTFRIVSRSAEAAETTSVDQHGSVALTAVPWLRRLVPVLFMLLTLAATAGLAWYLLTLFGVIRA
jgi:hypothetical protein